MAPTAHLAARFLGGEDGGSGGISATAIALIVCIGIIPVFALVWVVSWLLFCYPKDRNCCCVKRKKKSSHTDTSHVSTVSSEEMLYNEKHIAQPPKRPWASHERTESGSSFGSGRITKNDPKRPAEARLSVQSRSSETTIQIQQEPKRFV